MPDLSNVFIYKSWILDLRTVLHDCLLYHQCSPGEIHRTYTYFWSTIRSGECRACKTHATDEEIAVLTATFNILHRA